MALRAGLIERASTDRYRVLVGAQRVGSSQVLAAAGSPAVSLSISSIIITS